MASSTSSPIPGPSADVPSAEMVSETKKNGADADPPVPAKAAEDSPSHTFCPPGSSESRGPCPGLNTLSNHGYLPRDGRNITTKDFMDALQHPETYNISEHLARVLVFGGLGMMLKPPPISLHDLAEHHRILGIEHDDSVVHKNTAAGEKYAPTRCDTGLLNELLEGKEFITLDDVALRRVILEKKSKLDPVHREIARGEWALVLEVFGRAHGGRIPAEFLRQWLKEERFPEGWKPTHEQGLWDTVKKSWAIHRKMWEFEAKVESTPEVLKDGVLGEMLRTTPELAEGGRRLESVTPSPRPAKRQKTIP